MQQRTWWSGMMATLVTTSLILSGCGTGAAPTQSPDSGGQKAAAGPVELRYILWDSLQQPAYEACIAEFQKQNPKITVKIEQQGWNDYWNGIQTGFVSGSAPDVFTDHLGKYPEFANKDQLVDIQSLVTRDKVDLNQYLPGLADLWVKDGKRYGLPKDWDTIAIAYDPDAFKKAGIDPSVTDTWTWNPKDGGTFDQVLKKLTLDKNGKNALDPGFDKNNVVRYGFIPQGPGAASGQTEWSWLSNTTGWKAIDQPWGTKYHFDDPRIAETLQWYADLANVEHVAVPFTDVKSLGGSALFGNGKGVMTSVGSWQVTEYRKANPNTRFARLPIGPQGRKSMFNGLADSIWKGTKHPEESWQLVKFLASPTCENIVGEHNVVFPAIQSGIDKRLEANKASGLDISAFTKQATEKDGTFLYPITDNASQVFSIMNEATDAITLGQKKASEALPAANGQLNALFK